MKRVLIGAAALLTLMSAPAAGQPTPRGSTLEPGPCGTPGKFIEEAGLVRIGGIQQWITIGGQDCGNPVVLMVHGGPGNPNTPFSHALFGAWTADFVVVQWDQRGSGKTYAANPPGEDEALSMEQLTRDGVELAR